MTHKWITGLTWALVGLCACSLAFNSNQSAPPVSPPPSWGSSGDKWGHGLAYAAFAILLAIAMARSFQTWSIKTIAQTAWITAVLFGVTDEWHQSWIPGREMDPWDWAADSIGSGLGLILWGLLKYPNIPSHSSPWPNL